MLIIHHLHDEIIILHIHCHYHCWSHHSYSSYSSPPSYIIIYIITIIVKAVVAIKISALKRKTHAQVGGKKWMLLISSSLQFVSELCWRDITHVELRIKMLITQVCFMWGWMDVLIRMMMMVMMILLMMMVMMRMMRMMRMIMIMMVMMMILLLMMVMMRMRMIMMVMMIMICCPLMMLLLGNFWWADCNHIANLNPLNNRYDAWSCEFFVSRNFTNLSYLVVSLLKLSLYFSLSFLLLFSTFIFMYCNRFKSTLLISN